MQKKFRLRPWVIISAVAVILLVLLVSVDYFYHRQRIYHGVYIGGVAAGGMTIDEACKRLTDKMAQDGFGGTALNFSHNGLNLSFTCDELGVGIADKSCAEAYNIGRNRNHLYSYPARVRLLLQNVNIPVSFDVDADSFNNAMAETLTKVRLPPIDAAFTLSEDRKKVAIIPDVPGRELDLEATRHKLIDGLASYPSLPPPVQLAEREVSAAKTAAYLETLSVREEIASYSTIFSNAIPNRVHNIRLAAAALDGILIEQGSEFSFNSTVGNTGTEQGYKTAPVIVNRQLVEGSGGGVCQVSSTLYNAILFAGLEITERANHSLTVAYLPPGLDATVSYGWIDLKFFNNREHAVLMHTFIDGNKLTVSLYGNPIAGHEVQIFTTDKEVISPGVDYIETEELPPGTTEEVKKGQPGYRVTVWRVTYLKGEEVNRELVSRDVYSPVRGEIRIGTLLEDSSVTVEDRQENGEETENQLSE